MNDVMSGTVHRLWKDYFVDQIPSCAMLFALVQLLWKRQNNTICNSLEIGCREMREKAKTLESEGMFFSKESQVREPLCRVNGTLTRRKRQLPQIPCSASCFLGQVYLVNRHGCVD
jgi:hypothetical protein